MAIYNYEIKLIVLINMLVSCLPEIVYPLVVRQCRMLHELAGSLVRVYRSEHGQPCVL